MHNINYVSYLITISQKTITKEIDEHVKHETWQEGGHGLDKPIRFIDKVMSDYDSAKQFLKDNDMGWYDQLAVKYKSLPRNKTSKRLEELRQKRKELWKVFAENSNKVNATEFKAEFIGCKHCNSKINKVYIKSNYCPICNADMRSETTLKKIQATKIKLNNLDADIKEEERKLAEKHGDIKWLVKYEYHT